MASEHYSAFIEEAFLKPIRSVLIVDDDYPTFDEMLEIQIDRNAGQHVRPSTKAWYDNPQRVKGVIDSFRTPDRALLVDIHDGENVTVGDDVKVAAHLHQSDLLVLDYQLDKSRQGDGTRAINIVRSLMANDHFNLVVVHTKEDLDSVFESVVLGLLRPSPIGLPPDELQKADNLIEAGDEAYERFSDHLFQTVANAQYLHSRLHPSTYLRTMMKGQPPYSLFSQQCDVVEWAAEDRKLVLRRALTRTEQKLLPGMNANSIEEITWSAEPIKWIKSDSMFIAFSNKSDEDDLFTELQKALNDWSPEPSRLFLAKLRAEIDEYGVIAQTQALGNKHALAHWYDRLLRASDPQRRWYIAENVLRHSDQLMSVILPRVEEFATRLIAAELDNGDVTDLCKNHFKVDLAKAEVRQRADREHNAFVCSKKPEGWHLTTGHVFLMLGEYWLCLSPACDMVPAQLSDARRKLIGERMPFIAVRLQPKSDGKMPRDVQSNRFVFLQLDAGVKCFCFNDPSRDNSAPHWDTLYAENRGEFTEGFRFRVLRNEMDDAGFISKRYDAEVVCQLRYEYALNLIQRLGVSLTRVGLDFVG